VHLVQPDLFRSVRRFAYLAGAIVLVEMVPVRLDETRAAFLLAIAAAAAIAGLVAFALGAHRLAASVTGLELPDAVLRELRGIGLPLLGLVFFTLWTFVYVALWLVRPDEAFNGIAHRPRLADFVYFAITTSLTSPPQDIVPASRGARAASTIEILMGLALIGAYLASFRDRQRLAPAEDAGEILVPPAGEADKG
jgi:Ion channel